MIIIYPEDWKTPAGAKYPTVYYYNLPDYFHADHGGWAWAHTDKILAYNSVSGGVASGDFEELYNDWMAYNATIYTSDRCFYILNKGTGLKAFHLGDTGISINNGPYNSFVPDVDRSGNAEFYTGAGDDIIYNYNSSDSTISAGGGNNKIYNSSSNRVLIITGSGNDSVVNTFYKGSFLGQDVTIQTGEGDDTVRNHGDYVTINSGNGDDKIFNSGDNVKIYNEITTIDEDDNDYIKNSGSNVTIDSDVRNDTIDNTGENVSIETGYGDDSVLNYGKETTIQTGYGKDTVANYSENVTIFGGNDDDSIKNTGENVSINGGEGDDEIILYSGVPAGEAAEEYWNNLKEWLGLDDQTPQEMVDEFIENLKEVHNLINDYISGGEGLSIPDFVTFTDEDFKNPKAFVEKTEEFAGALSDWAETFEKFSSNPKVIAFSQKIGFIAGKASKLTGKFSKIITVAMGILGVPVAWAESRTAQKWWDNLLKEISKDFVMTESGRWEFATVHQRSIPVTVKGGEGDDIIRSDNYHFNVYEYASGDGDDTIYGASINDTLKISGGSYTTEINGNDYIIHMSSGGSVTLKDANPAKRLGLIPKRVIYIEGAEENTNDTTGGGNSSSGGSSAISDNTVNSKPPAGVYVNEGKITFDSNYSGEFDADYEYAANVTEIDGSNVSTGSLTIYGNSKTTKIFTSINDDNILSEANEATINSSNGNDNIINFGNNTSINGGAGDDVISNFGDNITINAGSGNDSVNQSFLAEANFTISGGSGNDKIYMMGELFGLNGGTVAINGDEDNDYIYIGSTSTDSNTYSHGIFQTKASLDGGKGNDTINIYAANGQGIGSYDNLSNVFITGNDGNDSINIFGNYEGIKLSKVSICAGKGNDTINIKGGTWQGIGQSTVTIVGDSGEDKINIESNCWGIDGSIVSIMSGDGADEININGRALGLNNSTLTIDGGKDNDAINIVASGGIYYSKATIKGGIGKDTIRINADEIDGSMYSNYLIDGGTENDYIHINGQTGIGGGSTVTAIGGSGNDSIIINANYCGIGGSSVSINSGIGNDVITVNGKNENGIDASEVNFLAGDGNDYIEINGSIHAIGNSSTVSIDGGAGNDKIIITSIEESSIVSINGGSNNDVISLSGNYSSKVTVSGGVGNDTIYFNNSNSINYQYARGDGNDVICGLNSSDTIQITGLKYSTVKSGADLKIKMSSGSILLKDAANISFKIAGTLDGGNSNETLPAGISIKSSVLTASKKFTGTEINLADYENVTKVNASALSQAVNIVGTDSVTSIKSGKGADTISGGNSSNTIYGGAGKDVFIHSGGNDFIADYKSGEDTIILTSGAVNNSSLKGSDIILYTDDGAITVKSAKNKRIAVTDGDGNTTTEIYGRVWYSENKHSASVASTFSGTLNAADYDSSVEILDASKVKASTKIFGNDNNNTISGSSKTDSIYGGKGNDLINGGAGNDKLFGENGNDTLSGGKGNDTLTGGNGADVFIYSNGDGNDFITDFVSGEDVIKISSGTVSNYSVSGGKDAVLKIGSGKITLKNIGNEKFTVIGADNSETVYGLADGLNFDKADLSKAVSVTISADYESETFDAANYKSLVKIDASNANELEIIGNAKNNSIIGTSGEDTIHGGKGNDTLTGGNGADIFVYSAGKDVITDYSTEDTIKLSSGKISKTTYKNNDVIFNVGSGSITVKNGKDKNISVTDSSGTKTYSRTVNLFYDNHFITDDTNLDSITEQKVSVTQIQTSEETFAQVENFLTYSKIKQ